MGGTKWKPLCDSVSASSAMRFATSFTTAAGPVVSRHWCFRQRNVSAVIHVSVSNNTSGKIQAVVFLSAIFHQQWYISNISGSGVSVSNILWATIQAVVYLSVIFCLQHSSALFQSMMLLMRICSSIADIPNRCNGRLPSTSVYFLVSSRYSLVHHTKSLINNCMGDDLCKKCIITVSIIYNIYVLNVRLPLAESTNVPLYVCRHNMMPFPLVHATSSACCTKIMQSHHSIPTTSRTCNQRMQLKHIAWKIASSNRRATKRRLRSFVKGSLYNEKHKNSVPERKSSSPTYFWYDNGRIADATADVRDRGRYDRSCAPPASGVL